jgi:hypothetical protein
MLKTLFDALARVSAIDGLAEVLSATLWFIPGKVIV